MDGRTKLSATLHEAGDVHDDVVYRITDGADDDWGPFYADWPIDHCSLSQCASCGRRRRGGRVSEPL